MQRKKCRSCERSFYSKSQKSKPVKGIEECECECEKNGSAKNGFHYLVDSVMSCFHLKTSVKRKCNSHLSTTGLVVVNSARRGIKGFLRSVAKSCRAFKRFTIIHLKRAMLRYITEHEMFLRDEIGSMFRSGMYHKVAPTLSKLSCKVPENPDTFWRQVSAVLSQGFCTPSLFCRILTLAIDVEIIMISARSLKVDKRTVVDRSLYPLSKKHRTITLIHDSTETVTYGSLPIQFLPRLPRPSVLVPKQLQMSDDESTTGVYVKNASDSSGSGGDGYETGDDWTRTEMEDDLVIHGREVRWMRNLMT
jgi:hypothetical protein